MKISVITVAFNSASTIEETILAVHAQTHREREHIVVDGGSTDGTVEIIRRHRDKIARFVSEPDSGIYDAMNKGLGLANGQVVGFLNSDDVFSHERVLERIAAELERAEFDAVYADLVYVDGGNAGRVVRYYRSGAYRPRAFLRGWMPAHPTFYARRGVYERCGGFNADYRLQADFDLLLRLFEIHGIRASYVPQIWVRMRIGGATNRSLGNVVRGNLEAYRSVRANGFRVTPLFMLRKVLSRVPQYFARAPDEPARGGG